MHLTELEEGEDFPSRWGVGRKLVDPSIILGLLHGHVREKKDDVEDGGQGDDTDREGEEVAHVAGDEKKESAPEGGRYAEDQEVGGGEEGDISWIIADCLPRKYDAGAQIETSYIREERGI